MKLSLSILLLIFSLPILAQDQVLEMYHPEKDKRIYFKENKRVKVKTLNGEKHIGRFRIMDHETIEIDGQPILLSHIGNIKRRSVAGGIVGTIVTIFGSALVVSGVVAATLFNDSDSAIPLLAVGGLVTASGILFNEFTENHKSAGWSYKIIEE